MRDYSVTIPARFANDAYLSEYYNLRYGYWGSPFHMFDAFNWGYLACACNY